MGIFLCIGTGYSLGACPDCDAGVMACWRDGVRLCLKTRSGFERPFFLNFFIDWRIKAAAVVRLAASGCIDDTTNIACFAVFVRQKNCSLSGPRWSFQKEPRGNLSG